jgi:hypothetical protein
MLQILVSCWQEIVARTLGSRDQLTILQSAPAELVGRRNFVSGLAAEPERLGQRQSSSSDTPSGILQDGFSLLSGDARKPLEVIINACAIFEILEKGRNGNSRATKDPRAALNFGAPLDGFALRPIQHRSSVFPTECGASLSLIVPHRRLGRYAWLCPTGGGREI